MSINDNDFLLDDEPDTGEYEVKGVSIFGVATFHDKDEGKTRGKNTAYVIEIDGASHDQKQEYPFSHAEKSPCPSSEWLMDQI